MRRLLVLASIAFAPGFLIATPSYGAVFLAGTCPGASHESIQSAVNAASNGDTINVCAGTFPELVNVNKTLTLNGAQTGVDGRSPSRTGLPATESVLTGNAGSTSLYITASDVRVDGFTIQGQTNPNQFGAGVVIGAGTAGTDLVNNIIQNNVVGVFLANNSTVNQTLIQHNLIRNNNTVGPAAGSGIYADQFVAGGTLRNVLIDANTFINNNDSAIDFSHTDAAAPATNITISNNHADGNARLLIALNLTNSTISGNTLRNSTFAASADLRLFEGSSNVNITNNTLQDGLGRAMRISNIGTGSPNASNIHLNFNSITGYAGVEAVDVDAGQYTGILDATCDWWGSATGPTHSSNPGGTGQSVSDGVDFTPWLTAPPPGGACSGGAVIAATQGTPQSAKTGTQYATPLQATVTIEGAPAAGLSVTFMVVPGPNGAGGTFSGSPTVVTDANGIATAPALTANAIPGPFTVTATIDGQSSTATFNLTNFTTALSITKTDAGDVYVGEQIVYTIEVTNTGTGNATNVTLTDPVQAPFVSLTSPGGWSCTTPAVGATGTVTCSTPALAPGTATFTLRLTAPGTPTTVNNTATVTASTEPAPLSASQSVTVHNLPTLSINDAFVTEGSSGTQTMTFTVTLAGTALRQATVNFATADGTATAPVDYVPAAGMLTFGTGVTTQTISVTINNDTIGEENESFFVNLSGPTNAAIADGQGVGTILSEDASAIPTLSEWMLMLLCAMLALIGMRFITD